ncbi:MAG: phosphoribosyltransferase family protein [Myxococcota bacterium]
MPPRCGGCLAWSSEPLCTQCRNALEPDLDDTPIPHLDACLAAVAYAGEVREWIQRFKYPRTGFSNLDPIPIGILQGLIVEAAQRAPGPPPELVVPVPLHAGRLRTRGFNPAALLTRSVAKATASRSAPRALRRIRSTPSQTGLDRAARRRNVAGAFICSLQPPRTVWLVDDIVTTGATLSECARSLRHHGARRIVAVCVARTPRRWGLGVSDPGQE